MKLKITLALSILCLKLAFAVGPKAPLDYEASIHSSREIKQMYNSLFKHELEGTDCFKRAYLWSYQLVRKFNARPIKVFFHYTDKFNYELDQLGIDTRVGRYLNRTSKRVWDFHVAPAVQNENGEIIVFDPTVFPGKGPMTVQKWVDRLVSRGERYLKRRKGMLYEELDSVRKKLSKAQEKLNRSIERGRVNSRLEKKVARYKSEEKEILSKMDYLGIINRRKAKKITCDQITHIEEFDKNQLNAWCFYQFTSMYYFATGELRVLNYGTLGNHAPGELSVQGEINWIIMNKFRWPVNAKNSAVAQYFENGQTLFSEKYYSDGHNYQMTSFSDYYLELSLEEVKRRYRPDLEYFKNYVELIDKRAPDEEETL